MKLKIDREYDKTSLIFDNKKYYVNSTFEMYKVFMTVFIQDKPYYHLCDIKQDKDIVILNFGDNTFEPINIVFNIVKTGLTIKQYIEDCLILFFQFIERNKKELYEYTDIQAFNKISYFIERNKKDTVTLSFTDEYDNSHKAICETTKDLFDIMFEPHSNNISFTFAENKQNEIHIYIDDYSANFTDRCIGELDKGQMTDTISELATIINTIIETWTNKVYKIDTTMIINLENFNI